MVNKFEVQALIDSVYSDSMLGTMKEYIVGKIIYHCGGKRKDKKEW